MSIKTLCPNCQKKLAIKDDFAGKRVKCPACGQPMQVPSAQAPPSRTTGQPRSVDSPSPGPVTTHTPVDTGAPGSPSTCRFPKRLIILSAFGVTFLLLGVVIVVLVWLKPFGARLEVLEWQTADALPSNSKIKIPVADMQLALLRTTKESAAIPTRLASSDDTFLVLTLRIPPALLGGETSKPDDPFFGGKWYYGLKREDFQLVFPDGKTQEAEGFVYNAHQLGNGDIVLSDRFTQAFSKPFKESIEWVVVFVVKKDSAGRGKLKIQFRGDPPVALE